MAKKPIGNENILGKDCVVTQDEKTKDILIAMSQKQIDEVAEERHDINKEVRDRFSALDQDMGSASLPMFEKYLEKGNKVTVQFGGEHGRTSFTMKDQGTVPAGAMEKGKSPEKKTVYCPVTARRSVKVPKFFKGDSLQKSQDHIKSKLGLG